jgi:RNA polymerase sigma factor (sigma-70 family)
VEAATTTLRTHGAKPGRPGWRMLRTDAVLVDRFRAGDDHAFAALYRRHQSRIYAVCLGVLGSPEDAKDAMQEVWAAATTGLRASAPDNVSAWLARVARNASIDIVRARRETPHPAPHDLRPDAARRTAAPGGDHTELGELVGALTTLPERQRSALVMRELGGYSYAEIARTLQLPERSVSGLIARARISLREARRSSLTCSAVRDLLAAELDGRRRPSEVRRHLRSCAGCRDFRVALRDDRRVLRSLAPAGAVKLVAAVLAGRGGRAAVVAAILGKGSAAGEAVKLAAFCAAAVCATAGVEEIGGHAAPHKRPSAGVVGSPQRPATSGHRRAATSTTSASATRERVARVKPAQAAPAASGAATGTATGSTVAPVSEAGGVTGEAASAGDPRANDPGETAGAPEKPSRDEPQADGDRARRAGNGYRDGPRISQRRAGPDTGEVTPETGRSTGAGTAEPDQAPATTPQDGAAQRP